MSPNVDAFIVYHKKTTNYFTRSVKSDPVSVSYVLIVFHEAGCLIIVPNKMARCLYLFFVFFNVFFHDVLILNNNAIYKFTRNNIN